MPENKTFTQKRRINRKKAEMSTQVIIGLIIGLITVLLIIFLLKDKMNLALKNTDCDSQGGECIKSEDCVSPRIYSAKCENNDVCCMKNSG